MGDIVGNPAHILHQLFDGIEHTVEVVRQLIEIVVGTAGGDSSGKIAVHDSAAGFVYGFKAPHGAARQHDAAGQRHHHRDCQPPGNRPHDQAASGVERVHIAADEKTVTAPKGEWAGASTVCDFTCAGGLLEIEVEPAVAVSADSRPAIQVADQRRQLIIG